MVYFLWAEELKDDGVKPLVAIGNVIGIAHRPAQKLAPDKAEERKPELLAGILVLKGDKVRAGDHVGYQGGKQDCLITGQALKASRSCRELAADDLGPIFAKPPNNCRMEGFNAIGAVVVVEHLCG